MTRHRYDLQQHDLGVSGPGSFVLKYLHDGSSSRSLDDLTSEENQQLGAWIRGLFETEAITNELISTCKPQEFYMLVATLFKQSLAACQAGVLTLDVLKSGFECRCITCSCSNKPIPLTPTLSNGRVLGTMTGSRQSQCHTEHKSELSLTC